MSKEIQKNTVVEMTSRQRDISVSEFFLKNRHLLGFDSPAKALLTTIKEAVDNGLDACEEAGILPEISIAISHLGDKCYQVSVEDNGPGIVENQIARIFGKLLYGSKFHKLSQSRGQQGMGISAAGMYAQLTTGKPLHVISRVAGEELATELYVSINTARNRPDLHKQKHIPWDKLHGTRVEAQIEGQFNKGLHSVNMYLKQTAIANPHVRFELHNPNGKVIMYERSSNELPPRPEEIKPHPKGIELGQLIQMLKNTSNRSLVHFLEHEFSRVGRKTARQIIQQGGRRLHERSFPKRIAHAQASALYKAMQHVAVSAPRTNCLVPIGKQAIYEGLQKEINAKFYVAVSRPMAVYRGNPFQVEVGIAYGQPGNAAITLDSSGHLQKKPQHKSEAAEKLTLHGDQAAHLLRFANRVPLLYEQAGCAITRAVIQTNWHAYGLQQPKGALPIAPMAIMVHIASVWVPFTSEAKEGIAAYPEIIHELKLGLQACGRQLASYLHHESQLKQEFEKRAYIERYLPHIGIALQEILEFSDAEREKTVAKLDNILQQRRKI